MTVSRIAVIDDERQIRRALSEALVEEGHNVMAYETAEAALRDIEAFAPDLILLDLSLPGMDGLEFCQRARTRCDSPIVVLSVRNAEREKVAALDLGADDYITKPFGMEELLARVRAHLRRRYGPSEQPSTKIQAGDLQIDFERRSVVRNGEEVRLTRTQYEILRYLILNAGRVVTHSTILQHVWGPAYQEDAASLRVHITHLRRKIEVDPARPKLIQTEIGAGYRFVMPEEDR